MTKKITGVIILGLLTMFALLIITSPKPLRVSNYIDATPERK